MLGGAFYEGLQENKAKNVFLLKALPAFDPTVSHRTMVILGIYADKQLAVQEVERLKSRNEWEDFQIEMWELKE